jgi:hypothetical protein
MASIHQVDRSSGVSIDQGDVLALVFGLLLVVEGQILEEAARLFKEVDWFV